MKIKMSSEMNLKMNLLAVITSEWEFQVLTAEDLYANKISSVSDNISRVPNFSQKELIEHDARIALSALKTPLVELKKTANNIAPQGETIGDFSLFDLTVSERGKKDRILTYFVLPLKTFERQVSRIKFEGVNVDLLLKDNEYVGKALNYKIKHESHEVFEERNKFQDVSTGKFTNEINIKITHIYK